MRLITLDEYLMGRDKGYPEDYTEQIAQNAQETVRAMNEFLKATLFDGHVNSGWRPPMVNAAKGGSPHSKHLLALACDLYDLGDQIDRHLDMHPGLLDAFGLWREAPSATPGWCHLQIVQYASWTVGAPRTFKP